MKTLSLILAILLISVILFEIYRPDHIPDSGKMVELQDSFKRLQASKDLLALQINHLTTELSISRAAVKRSEDNLSNTKEKERIDLKVKKQAVLKMTEAQADSATKQRFISDPDSIPQKVEFDLEKLLWCDSVRAEQDRTIAALNTYVQKADSVTSSLDSMNTLLNDQVSVLNSSSAIKDKQIKKLKRRERVLKVAIPVAFVLGVVLMI